MKINFYLIFFVVFSTTFVKAQQLPIFTQYREMQGFINPASISSDYPLLDGYNLNVGATTRLQWIKNPGTPRTYAIHGEYLTPNDGAKLLTGGYLIRDEASRVKNTGVYGRVGTIISNDPKEYGISGALSLGLLAYSLDLDGIVPRDPGDLLATSSQTRFNVDAGLGVYGYKKLGRAGYAYGGLSVPQILGVNTKYKSLNKDSSFVFKRARHYYANGGILIPGQDETSYFEINTWVRYIPHSPINADINFRFSSNRIFWLGAGYNTGKLINLEGGIYINNDYLIRVGFAYSYTLGTFHNAFGDIYEFNVSTSLSR